MSIMSYNGGVVVAMKGIECVAIAADWRLGVRGHTISLVFERIFEMGPKLYCGLPVLATDTKTVAQRLKFRINLYELHEGRSVTSETLGSVISYLLYERRSVQQCYGMCETLWEPDMGPDELFEATAQALINAFNRDSFSGWGGVVHIIEKDKVTTKHLKTRMD
ncbi:hypothetical protein MRX96_056800 [Rhipicephalus microplus]